MHRGPDANESGTWKQILMQRLPLYGHRNWIVVADAAYPAQSAAGVETILAVADHLDVVRQTLACIQSAHHVRARIHIDLEMRFLRETDAPGIDECRKSIQGLLQSQEHDAILHEEIIARLDRSGSLFNVLVIKTPLAIPYTSVFFELECGYWNDDSERKLRDSMSGRQQYRPFHFA